MTSIKNLDQYFEYSFCHLTHVRVEIPKFYGDQGFCFENLMKNEAKQDKRHFKKGLTVTFEIKSVQHYCKNRLKILQVYFFGGK